MRHIARDVRIVSRSGSFRSTFLNRQPSSSQERDERPPQRHPRIVAATSDRSNVGARGQRQMVGRHSALLYHRYPPFSERIAGERRDVPSARKLHRRAALQDTRVRFGDNVELLHAGTARNPTL